jgi:3'-phosphoadenosine 5'-phosphosulfate sulfotransferase (PAPS reductase)/FAD synthetase
MVKIVVPVSGGKDSQACLKLASQQYPKEDILGLFCDTQWEHPITYKHVEEMGRMYGVSILTVTGGSVVDKVLKYSRFPMGGSRFCTDELKIRETRIFLKEYAKTHKDIQVWYGMRSDESPERNKRYRHLTDESLYLPHEVLKKYPKYLGKDGVRFKLPILEWSSKEVFEFLEGEQNPLYSQGFDRVGCFPCLAAGDKWKHKAFEHDGFGKEQYQKVIWMESQTGRSAFGTDSGRKKHEQNKSNGCAICSI